MGMLFKSGVFLASTALAYQSELALFSSVDTAPEGCDPLPTEAQWSKLSRRQQYNYVKSVRSENQNGDICYPNALTFWQLKNVKGICMVIPQIECRNNRNKMWKPEDHALGNNEWDTSSYSWCCEADADNCVLNMMVCSSIIDHTAGIQPNIPRLPDMFQRTAQGVQSAHAELDEPDFNRVNLNDLDNILLLPRGLTYHMFVQVWGEHLEDFRSASNCPPGGCTVMFPIQPLTNYGCWCNMKPGDLTKGAGLPQDSFDETCRDFQLCLRCARWDAKQDGTYTCDPVTDGYVGVGSSNFVVDCDAGNPTDCGAHLCMCYTNFYASLLIISGAHQQLLIALREHTLETFTTQQVLLIMTRFVPLMELVLVAIWIAAVSTQAGFPSVLAIKVAAVITSSILLLNAAMVLHPSVIFNQSAHVREIVR